MIYCPILDDYVFQEKSCVGCQHYSWLLDLCERPEDTENPDFEE